MNIGYVESIQDYDWQSFVFHDIDLLPEDDRLIYASPGQPVHISTAIDSMDFKYSHIFVNIYANKERTSTTKVKEVLVTVAAFQKYY